MNDKLVDKFKYIKENHLDNIQRRISKTALGPITRRFAQSTRKELSEFLSKNIDLGELTYLQSQEDYKKWFEKTLCGVAKVIEMKSPRNLKPSIYPGYKWGYAAKILNLFIRDIVTYSRYFDKDVAERIREWLYVPIDSRIISCLRKLDVELGFNFIKDIDTPRKYYAVQELLGEVAKKVGAPRIWFDDVWAMDS